MSRNERAEPTRDGATLVTRAGKSTVASLFASRARVHPDRPALDDGARVVSYGELDRRAASLAGALLSRGVGRGDRVAVLSENRDEFLELVLAAGRLGAIVACQNRRLAAPELRHCLDLVEPSCDLRVATPCAGSARRGRDLRRRLRAALRGRRSRMAPPRPWPMT